MVHATPEVKVKMCTYRYTRYALI